MSTIKSIILLLLCFFKFTFGQGDYESDQPILTISNGQIKGTSVTFRGSKIYQFLGIPFAEPPIGELRFEKPVTKKPWNKILHTNQLGPHCIQPDFPGFNEGYNFSEDCLLLNVLVTKSTFNGVKNGQSKPRPVMVWIHGGGFSYGSANCEFYNGTVLTTMNDIIFVSINYRLGPFGFLYLPESGIPGNMGLWDQLLALKWIKENIHFFGGDPDKVTIFGESAGSMSVSAHIVSPHSRGLFKNAIMQSGSIYDMNYWYDTKSAETLLEKLKCSSFDSTLSCLRSADASTFNLVAGFLYWPVFGDEFLPDQPRELMKNLDEEVNILLGAIANEGASMLVALNATIFNPMDPVNLTTVQAQGFFKQLFGEKHLDYFTKEYLSHIEPENFNEIRLAISHAIGDVVLTCPTYIFGQDAAQTGFANVYAYIQTQKPSKSTIELFVNSTWIPATHGDDIPMMFGAPLSNPSDYTQEDILLSTLMVNIWGNFAKFSEPRFFGDPTKWTVWDSDESYKTENFVMELNSERFGLINNKWLENCQKNWPFPIETINLALNFDEINKLKHDEL